ncbi:phage tail assembly protein [Limimaricola cinnabarinus]|uniref:phage tail assembly protein n=1 Tax=Limimaricola cinnabarinus TaxID=1125964 RepID=UPI002FE393E7
MDRKLPEYITEGEDGSLSVTLARGLDVAGAKVKAVRLREPTLDDQLAAQSGKTGSAESEVALIANLAEITPEELRRAKMRDYGRLQEALGFFYG